MKHHLNLHPGPYLLIKSGQKTIEMRLNDEKRRDIKIGDFIIFTNRETGEKLEVKVVEVLNFPSFDVLYNRFPHQSLGYLEGEKADPRDMEIYYDKSEIEKYGVLAIHIERELVKIVDKMIKK